MVAESGTAPTTRGGPAEAGDRPAGAGRLVAVVVTFNRLDKLKQTLSALLAAPQAELEALLVIDNASTDGTAEWLAGLDEPRLQVIRQDRNLGGAGGFEVGLRAAGALDPDWTLVMDDDARPAPGALAAFHAAPRGEREGWLAAVHYPDGAICDMNRPWINPFWHRSAFLRTLRKGRSGFHLPRAAYEAALPSPVDGGSFVGLFLSRRGLEMAGLPDPSLFIYGDDVLYTLGLTAAGGRLAFDPGLRFVHDCTTLEPGPQVFRPLWKSYYHHRNLMMVYRRAAGPVLFWPALLLVVPKWLLKTRAYRGQRRAYLRLLGRALRHGLTRRTDVAHDEIVALAAPR